MGPVGPHMARSPVGARPPAGGMQEETNQCISHALMFLSLSFSQRQQPKLALTSPTHLSFTWSWFIQQESIWISFKSIISLGRTKGIPQVLGAGLGVGGRGGGNAAAPAPVSAGGAAAAVRHIAALLPWVTGCTGSWRRKGRGCSWACPQAELLARPCLRQIPHGQPSSKSSRLECESLSPIPGSGSAWPCHFRGTKPKPSLSKLR